MEGIKSLTLTILTESQIALSNDQGEGGNYVPVKKMFYKDGIHLFSSVSTFTFELRRILKESFGWKMFDIAINKSDKGKTKNVYNLQIEDISNEADLFGYLVPDQQVSRVSPLRIIPPVSLNKYHSDTQLITNRGFLNRDLGRAYFNITGKEKEKKSEPTDDIPTAQALATEEIMGDYYRYTVTLELDRIGRIENKQSDKILTSLAPLEYSFKNETERKKIITDFLKAITIFTRRIKHQTIFLEPLAVFGGLFTHVVPYFANSIHFQNNKLRLDSIKQTVKGYELEENSRLITAVNPIIETLSIEGFEIKNNPVEAIKSLIHCIDEEMTINEKNEWILKGKK